MRFMSSGLSRQAAGAHAVNPSAYTRRSPLAWATAVWRGTLGHPQFSGLSQNSVQKQSSGSWRVMASVLMGLKGLALPVP